MQGDVKTVEKLYKKFENSLLTYNFILLFQLEQATPLTWGWGFIGGRTEQDHQSEGESNIQSGYHSAENTIILDSEDDLFFLVGELATTCHCE